MTLLRVLAMGALLLTAPTFAAAAPTRAAAFPPPGVRMEVINLPSAPPGKMAEAPGGGVVTTPAVMFNPASGENIYGPAIVMIDSGPASHPLLEGEPTRFAAARLAAKGYTVISLYTHLVRGYPLFPFEAVGPEIDAALYYLEQRGHEGFALVGKGYGAVAAADYLRRFKDEPIDSPNTKRVKAVALFSPLTELRAYPAADLQGPGYEATAKAATASVASGAGRFPAGSTLEVGGAPTGKVDPWFGAGPFNGPPESFVQWWSPQASERNLAALASIRLPTLVIGAGGDPTYSEAHLRQLLKPASLKVESFPNAGPHFTGVQAQASDDLAAWLADQGLVVRPKVVESVMDVTAADGRDLPAVIYEPEGGATPNKPTFLFLHGRTGDLVQSSGHWVGWRLAQHGYRVVTPRMRVSGTAGFSESTFADVQDDVGRWMNALDAAGMKKVILVGHSNGGIYASVYMSKSQDSRVKGVVFMAPTVNEREHDKERDGAAKFNADLTEAKAAIDRGEGLSHMIGFLTARVYWDVNNPNSLSTHTDRIKEYSRPTLSIIGRGDPLFQGNDFATRFIANQKPGLGKLIWIDGGSHGFRESKDVVADDIDAWTRATFGH